MCHILLVEDNQLQQDLWRQVLTPLTSDMKITTADSVFEALKCISGEDKPEILILDWLLHGTPADVILDTWATEVRGPICVVTGQLDDKQSCALYSRGVWNTFLKPLSLDVLVGVVRNYVAMVDRDKQILRLLEEIQKLRKTLNITIGVIVVLLGGRGLLELVPIIVGLL